MSGDHGHGHGHGHGHDHGHGEDADPDGRIRWHEETHDGRLEHASIRLGTGPLHLFINVGIELDGRFSARVETLNATDETVGHRDPPAAKRAALARARALLEELTAHLALVAPDEDP